MERSWWVLPLLRGFLFIDDVVEGHGIPVISPQPQLSVSHLGYIQLRKAGVSEFRFFFYFYNNNFAMPFHISLTI